MDGLDAMLENGPWFIRNNLLILKKWHLDENLLKEDVSTILVWVKLYGIPVTAFSENGLSAIATKLGTPLMLDSYISNMYMQSWGRSSYARVMIELKADVKLKDNIIVAMPKITREGHYTCNVRAEYKWKPPRCSSCKVFRHVHEECTKNTGAGEKKTVKKPSQTSRGAPVGPKIVTLAYEDIPGVLPAGVDPCIGNGGYELKLVFATSGKLVSPKEHCFSFTTGSTITYGDTTSFVATSLFFCLTTLPPPLPFLLKKPRSIQERYNSIKKNLNHAHTVKSQSTNNV
nr:hypothetical protein [Tanacetum cinerariifolium]